MSIGFNDNFRPDGVFEINRNLACGLRSSDGRSAGKTNALRNTVTLTNPSDAPVREKRGGQVQGVPAPPRARQKEALPVFKRKERRKTERSSVHHEEGELSFRRRQENRIAGNRKMRAGLLAVRAMVRWRREASGEPLGQEEAFKVERMYTHALHAGVDLSTTSGLLGHLQSSGCQLTEQDITFALTKSRFIEHEENVSLQTFKSIFRHKKRQDALRAQQSHLRHTFHILSDGGDTISRSALEAWLSQTAAVGIGVPPGLLQDEVDFATFKTFFDSLDESYEDNAPPTLHLTQELHIAESVPAASPLSPTKSCSPTLAGVIHSASGFAAIGKAVSNSGFQRSLSLVRAMQASGGSMAYEGEEGVQRKARRCVSQRYAPAPPLQPGEEVPKARFVRMAVPQERLALPPLPASQRRSVGGRGAGGGGVPTGGIDVLTVSRARALAGQKEKEECRKEGTAVKRQESFKASSIGGPQVKVVKV